MTALATDQRWVPIANTINLRDVGGLPCADGTSIRSRRLLRGGSLRQMTSADADALITRYDVSTVLDLRTARELRHDGPSALARAGIATTHLPLIDEDRFALPESDTDHDATTALTTAYHGYLDARGHHIVAAAGLIASSRGATLVHCAAGKDRTGVTVAILLDAVGVDRAAIVEDYAATNDRIDTIMEQLGAAYGYGDQITRVPLAAHLARPAALETILRRLDEQHGGAAGWLASRGLDQPILTGLRRQLVG